jgi:hypothetical protein
MSKLKSHLTQQELFQRSALQAAMEQPLFSRALNDVYTELAEEMLITKDSSARDELYHIGVALKKVENKLKSYLNDLIGTDDNAS